METAVKNTGKPDWSFKKNFERMLSSSCPLATTSIIFVDIITNKVYIGRASNDYRISLSVYILNSETTKKYMTVICTHPSRT